MLKTVKYANKLHPCWLPILRCHHVDVTRRFIESYENKWDLLNFVL